MNPQVSVIVPTYNRRHLVGPTLAGALAQEDVDLEVVVVDDCSPDGTAEYLTGLELPRLRVFRNDVNRLQAFTRNRGIAEARGEWIAFLDDDDLWAPNKLREQLRVAEEAEASIAFSAAYLLNQDKFATDVFYPCPPETQPAEILTRYTVPAGCSNMIVRADLLDDVGGFDEHLDTASDWDLFIRLLLTRPAAVLNEPHVGYVLHDNAVSTGNIERQFEDFEFLRRKYQHARREYGVEADGVQFSRWLAAGLRRGGRRMDAMRAYIYGGVHYRNFGNLVRAAAVPLGERWMKLGSKESEYAPAVQPEWLDLYRPGGKLAELHPAASDLVS